MANEAQGFCAAPQHWGCAAALLDLLILKCGGKSRFSCTCSMQEAQGNPQEAEHGHGRWGRCWNAA